MGGSHLTVFIPGLSQALLACRASIDCQVLKKLLSKGAKTSVGSSTFASAAFSTFDFPETTRHGLPVAAVSYLGITDRPPEGWCLRIDPAHLETRLTKLYLIAGKPLAVCKDEAESLIAILGELYRDDEWRIYAPDAEQWYLMVSEDPGVIATPIAEALGKDVDMLLPDGAKKASWHARMNEIQMAFHASPVNARREEEARYTINTIWPWGSGALPESTEQVWQRVWSDEPLTRGLAKLGGSRLSSAPTNATEIIDRLTSGAALLVLGDHWSVFDRSDPDHAREELRDWENRWWRPLWVALKTRELNSLTITGPALDTVTIRDQDVRRWPYWARFLTSKQVKKDQRDQ